MSANITKGDELMVFMGGTALAFATAHTLTINGNTIDTSSKDHGFWGSSQVGNLTWEVTTDNLYTVADYDRLYDAMIAKTPVEIVFAPASNYDENGLRVVGGRVQAWVPGAGRKGDAVITSLVANANTGENATFTATFTGNGPLTKVTPA